MPEFEPIAFKGNFINGEFVLPDNKTGSLISRLTRAASSVERSFDTIIYQLIRESLK